MVYLSSTVYYVYICITDIEVNNGLHFFLFDQVDIFQGISLTEATHFM